ncbi:hypothetical protein BD779DRAFT_1043244 [Infundibulicybe gibba]|nr:hypothetical protein BD779DRAFT_1043244 [Infundibulicybe gibba]
MGSSFDMTQNPRSHSPMHVQSIIGLRVAATTTTDKPFSKNFWDSDANMTKARGVYLRFLAQRVVILIVVIFTIFALYWASLWKLSIHSLDFWVVDFDGREIGEFVSRQLNNISEQGLKWQIRPANAFPNGESDLVAAILDKKCWAAVAIAAGSTTRLNASLTSLDQAYNASLAITLYTSEARNENAYRSSLKPIVESLEAVAHIFAVQFASNIQTNGLPMVVTPETLVRPLYYTLNNLRPFDESIAGAVTFTGFIYLLILSFIVPHTWLTGQHTSMTLITPILIYLIISGLYTLLSLAFGLPLQRQFGHSGFVIFWMLSLFGMMTTGLALESTMTLLTETTMQIFFMLWIIGNMSVCLWPIEALPKAFAYGYVSPFYNISRAVRAVVLGGKNQYGDRMFVSLRKKQCEEAILATARTRNLTWTG